MMKKLAILEKFEKLRAIRIENKIKLYLYLRLNPYSYSVILVIAVAFSLMVLNDALHPDKLVLLPMRLFGNNPFILWFFVVGCAWCFFDEIVITKCTSRWFWARIRELKAAKKDS